MSGSAAGAGNKTPKQEAALEQFKERIADIRKPHHDDHELHKWLKAREYHVGKAEDMYRASMAYRDKMHVDKLLEEYTPPEVLQKYLTGGFCGHDKEGSRVRVELYGHLDMKGIMYSARKVDLEKTKLLQCESTVQDWQEQSRLRGRRVDGLTVIFDMENVSSKMLWRPGLQMYLHLVKVLEDNYPEMMKRMFVINAPRIFPLLYKLSRPLISEDMKNKIHVLGGNFRDTLLQYIDAEELPGFLGGVKTDPDGNPRCASMICQGGPVPAEFFLQTRDSDDQLETASVSRGEKLSLSYEVIKPGSVLRWEFKTDDYDIGFGVFLKTSADKKREAVLPVQRVNSHMVPEDGSLVCQQAGTYELLFDNSFSWARSKRVQYSVDMIGPVDENVMGEITSMLLTGSDVDWDTIAEHPNIETTKF